MVYILFKFLMPSLRLKPGTPNHDLFVTNDDIRTIDKLDCSAMGPNFSFSPFRLTNESNNICLSNWSQT